MKPNTRWIPLFLTNFLGVFNNNFIKNLICFVAILWVSRQNDNDSMVVTLASGLYVVSYIFFSPLAGRLSKIFEKKKIMFFSKAIEIPIFILSICGFYFQSINIVMISIFLLGLISTLFSPSKYGLIRDIGGNEGISFGTGTLEMLTFFGVLLGTLAASIVSDHFNILTVTIIVILASASALLSISKLKVNESEPLKYSKETINPLKFLIQLFRHAGEIKGMNYIIAGLASFWMIGNLIQMNLIVHCPKVLGMTNTQTGIVMTCAAIGIGLGSYLAGVISKGTVELGITPFGAIGMIVNLSLIYFLHPTGILFSALVFLSAFSCGVYMVPLSAYVQSSIEGRFQGDMIAYSNFTCFLLILISSGLFGATAKYFDTNMVFLVLVFIVIVITYIMLNHVPGMYERFKKLIFSK
jgi:MFS family permease